MIEPRCEGSQVRRQGCETREARGTRETGVRGVKGSARMTLHRK